MALQTYPVCFGCTRPVEYDAVYEAPCGHDGCPSAVFHGVCLMEWRERRDEAKRRFRKWVEEHRRG